MTTPAEKDAMALALLDAEIASCGRLEPEDCENCARIREARAHLAARIADQAQRIAQLEANENTLLRNFNRAEAELAAVREDAERYRWLRDSGDIDLCVTARGSNPTHPHLYAYYRTAGDELDTDIDAARGAG